MPSSNVVSAGIEPTTLAIVSPTPYLCATEAKMVIVYSMHTYLNKTIIKGQVWSFYD